MTPLHRLWVALGQQELPRDILEHSQLSVGLPGQVDEPRRACWQAGEFIGLQSPGAAPRVEVHLKAELCLMGNQLSPEPISGVVQSWVVSLLRALCRGSLSS